MPPATACGWLAGDEASPWASASAPFPRATEIGIPRKCNAAGRARLRARTGKDAFEYDHAVRNGAADHAVHPKMDPRGVRVRESRDSDAHPESHAVVVLFDVTGSMHRVPRVLQAHLPKLMG